MISISVAHGLFLDLSVAFSINEMKRVNRRIVRKVQYLVCHSESPQLSGATAATAEIPEHYVVYSWHGRQKLLLAFPAPPDSSSFRGNRKRRAMKKKWNIVSPYLTLGLVASLAPSVFLSLHKSESMCDASVHAQFKILCIFSEKKVSIDTHTHSCSKQWHEQQQKQQQLERIA